MDFMDFTKIKPWNSKEFPVKINNIRFNQDYTLLTLATSRGYKIFSSESLRQVQEETELVRDFGDLNIVMTYYSSNIVFFSGKKNNPNINAKQLIIFDDFTQKILSHFISKDENIIDFYVSKNVLFIALENKLLILEIISMKIINIIEKVEINNKLLSFNNFDSVAYSMQKIKKKVLIDFYFFKKHVFNYIRKITINTCFDGAQLIKISPSGNFIAIVSEIGTKIHIYNNSNNKLMECLLIGTKVFNIERLSFLNRKENYIMINIDNKKIVIYKINKNILKDGKCICKNYSDDDIINGRIKLDNNYSFFNYFWVTKNQDIKESHGSVISPNIIIFSDFFFILKKCFVIIDKNGYFYIYFFMKDKINKLIPYCTCKWI